YAGAHVALPDPLAEPARYADAVGAAVRAHGCELVIPVTDASVLAILTRPQVVAPARVPLPALTQVQRLADKDAAAAAASAVGIRVPRQERVESRGDVEALAGRSGITPPLVLKPARSVAGGNAGRTKHGVAHATDWREACSLAASLPDGAF